MSAIAIRWLRWAHPRTGKTLVHAFLVDADGHIHRAVCKKKPRAGYVELVLAPGSCFEDMCIACDKELRSKGRERKKTRAQRSVTYQPRFRFEDWAGR